jgi:protein-L-isoaspartate(D-aspartate) O-methyltransferase
MVRDQLAARGVRDPGVLEAMRTVPRHDFVPERLADDAYADHPLPIGRGQTISQPYIVAYMTEAAAVRPGSKVLEIGTGCGYQTAVLAAMGARVFSVELIPALAELAAGNLDRLGYAATARCSDGYAGWPEEAPFDAIVVTAAPRDIPRALVEQLCEGGRLVIPVGNLIQDLTVLEKRGGALVELSSLPVRFVPMVRREA